MKWEPGECRYGDVIRVRLGAISHYGVFASENEVIQFGLPPVPAYKDSPDRVRVVATSVGVFSCGKTVERAVPDENERKTAFSPEQTVARARARLGEGGYNIIHNNCEHFVNECAYGVRFSQTEEDARRRWTGRPLLDVYIAPVPKDAPVGVTYPPEREAEIASCRNEEVKREKYFAWKLLEAAVKHSYSLSLSDLRFEKQPGGKWTCDRLHFSLSHTKGAAVVAVSNAPVGADAENEEELYAKYADPAKAARMLKKIRAKDDPSLDTVSPENALAVLWTSKESVFKRAGTGSFAPSSASVSGQPVLTRRLIKPVPLTLSVCSENVSRIRYYISDYERSVMMDSSFFLNDPL